MERQQGKSGGHGAERPTPQGTRPSHTQSSRPPPQPPPPNLTPHYGDLPNPARFADLAALDALAAELGGGTAEPLRLEELYALNLADLTARARALGVTFEGPPNRKQALEALLRFAA